MNTKDKKQSWSHFRCHNHLTTRISLKEMESSFHWCQSPWINCDKHFNNHDFKYFAQQQNLPMFSGGLVIDLGHSYQVPGQTESSVETDIQLKNDVPVQSHNASIHEGTCFWSVHYQVNILSHTDKSFLGSILTALLQLDTKWHNCMGHKEIIEMKFFERKKFYIGFAFNSLLHTDMNENSNFCRWNWTQK